MATTTLFPGALTATMFASFNFAFGLNGGGVRVALSKPRGQPAIVVPT